MTETSLRTQDDLAACEVCAHCLEQQPLWYCCSCANARFGKIDCIRDCEQFEFAEDEDEAVDEYEGEAVGVDDFAIGGPDARC